MLSTIAFKRHHTVPTLRSSAECDSHCCASFFASGLRHSCLRAAFDVDNAGAPCPLTLVNRAALLPELLADAERL